MVYLAIVTCQQNNGGCDQLCTNTPSGVNCSCNNGYSLMSDDKSCEGEFTLNRYYGIHKAIAVMFEVKDRCT